MLKRLSVFSLYAVLFSILLFSPKILAQSESTESVTDTLTQPAYDSLFLRERTPQPAFEINAYDNENDKGDAIVVNWEKSPDDYEGGNVMEYKILRSTSPDGEFSELGSTPQGNTTFTDFQAPTATEYYYKIVAVNFVKSDGNVLWTTASESAVIGPVKSVSQWFNMSRLVIFIGTILLSSSIIYFIFAAKSGKKFYIRKIAGIEEVENAVGRATEMGRSIYYVPGIHDMDDVQTLASMSILGRVATIAAENDTRIDVPVCRSMVMVTAKEVVKEAYSKAGRPDSFIEDQVRYLTDDQFGYAAAIDGLFVREKPATIFLIGTFFAESLIMAETGNSIGAIQIAGTAMPAQLPFFVAACDYTLIGEELFAASAYLTGEPKLLGSLKGQDVGKVLCLTAIIVGVILLALNPEWNISGWFAAH
ncbi:MAG: fibronectin type III domain-containing protein [candidate division Zixibacteria bacterium]